MAILKCKMCGGNLNIEDESSVVECEYCGTKQTVPSADNEKKMSLFGRANRLRFNCEFDKASGIYESIIEDFPEEAEAYWGLLLCKYGIEYVDDPATGKKIPTCHRSSFDSIMDDDDFEQVMENTDSIALSLYREEAKAIEELRKQIVEVSNKEQPYDIFICYKETDENGDRTVDSLIAQGIYDALTNEGYRVFFSRISLEDKLGTAYEPYIFAALNSAKIMLAVGTTYQNYNAVWVKNEWSRFLQLIAKGEKKTLIPCYKDIDAYDIPKEFKHLQAQDMGKVGAISDLIRGVKKLLPREKETHQSSNVDYSHNSSNSVVPLMERATIFLDDGNWSSADRYFERVLDVEPKNARAYLGKMLAHAKCRNRDELLNSRVVIEELDSYNAFLRFSDETEFCDRLKKHDEAERELRNIEEQNRTFSEYKYAIESTKNEKLIEPQMAIKIVDFISNNADYANSSVLNSLLNDYCNNLELNTNYIDEMKRINIDSSALGSWIFYKTDDLTDEKAQLCTIQEKATDYYLTLLKKGKVGAKWDSSSYGSLLGVQRNKNRVFTSIEEQIHNKFLIEPFYKGLENASKLNSIVFGDDSFEPYVFCYGNYAVKGRTELNDFNKSQFYIDGIEPDDVEDCYMEMNDLAKGISVEKAYRLLHGYGISPPFGSYVRIDSISPKGLIVSFVDTTGSTDKQLSNVRGEDIRALRVEFRKAAGRCQYCGASFKGVFTKVCTNSNCRKEKDYNY